MSDLTDSPYRRLLIKRSVMTLAGIAVVAAGIGPAHAKGKAKKDDFYFQETPDEDTGHSCPGCINFTPKDAGQYGKDSGDCALLQGDVCTHCYCQGWTDKNDPKSKKAGT